jgi:hypothetical protein
MKPSIWILTSNLLFLWALPLHAEPDPLSDSAPASVVQEGEFHWQKSCNTEGLTLYWSKVDGSKVIAFKGEGIVDEPIEKVATVIIDTTRGTEWIDSLLASKVVRAISKTEFIEYDHVGIPFPFDTIMSDRDFVSHVYLEADPKTKRMTVSYLPAEDDLAPVLKKYTRGRMTCVFKLVPMSMSDETYVEAEIHCDPKGNVPKWLVNFFQQGWPQTTFENLRKEVQKSDIMVLPVISDLLGNPEVKLAKRKED